MTEKELKALAYDRDYKKAEFLILLARLSIEIRARQCLNLNKEETNES